MDKYFYEISVLDSVFLTSVVIFDHVHQLLMALPLPICLVYQHARIFSPSSDLRLVFSLNSCLALITQFMHFVGPVRIPYQIVLPYYLFFPVIDVLNSKEGWTFYYLRCGITRFACNIGEFTAFIRTIRNLYYFGFENSASTTQSKISPIFALVKDLLWYSFSGHAEISCGNNITFYVIMCGF